MVGAADGATGKVDRHQIMQDLFILIRQFLMDPVKTPFQGSGVETWLK